VAADEEVKDTRRQLTLTKRKACGIVSGSSALKKASPTSPTRQIPGSATVGEVPTSAAGGTGCCAGGGGGGRVDYRANDDTGDFTGGSGDATITTFALVTAARDGGNVGSCNAGGNGDYEDVDGSIEVDGGFHGGGGIRRDDGDDGDGGRVGRGYSGGGGGIRGDGNSSLPPEGGNGYCGSYGGHSGGFSGAIYGGDREKSVRRTKTQKKAIRLENARIAKEREEAEMRLRAAASCGRCRAQGLYMGGGAMRLIFRCPLIQYARRWVVKNLFITYAPSNCEVN
jgi:hypothetical protein